jgi:hypothetical protein
MIDQSNTEQNTPVVEQPASGADALSFSDYEKFRRGELKLDTAPGEKPVQKAAANSEPAETEEEEGDELEASEDATEESDKPKKKSGGFQRKISKMTARQRALEAEIEQLRAQAANRGTDQQKQDAKVESKVEVEGKPSPDAFETHAEYVEALTDWKLEQRESKAKAEAERSKLMSEQEKVQKNHFERVKAFAEKHEDFQEVLESVDDIAPSTGLVHLLTTSADGPALMYELCKNREEYARIAQLSYGEMAFELGQIKARLSSKASELKPEPKKLTSAPKPIGPVGGSKGTVAKSISDPDLSFSDYEKLRRAQMKRR